MTTRVSSRFEIKATIQGEAFTDIPADLFIPPDALEVLLDSFTGPLDLLLYLIKKQNLDIMDIPIVQITQQYLHYIQAMEAQRLALAAEYLVMAAMLIEIKSKMLLPVRTVDADEEEVDPRMELARRLQDYEAIKAAAEALNALPQQGRENFAVQADCTIFDDKPLPPALDLNDLLAAMQTLICRESYYMRHEVKRESFSVKERCIKILSLLETNRLLAFSDLYAKEEGRGGIVVSLLAVLALASQSLIGIIQNQSFGSIYIRSAEHG